MRGIVRVRKRNRGIERMTRRKRGRKGGSLWALRSISSLVQKEKERVCDI